MKRPNIKSWIKKHPYWSAFIGFIFLWRFLGHYPWFYMSGPIEGYVQDQATGQPVVGAVAVLLFRTKTNRIHGTKSKTVYLAESVTDDKSRFFFKSWGPRLNSFGYRPISDRVPTISVYKQGCRVSAFHNIDPGDRLFGFDFIASENPIALEQYTEQELKTMWLSVQGKIGARGGPSLYAIGPRRAFTDCGWRDAYYAIIESDKLERNLRNKYGGRYGPLIEELPASWTEEYGCPDPREYFKKYLDGIAEQYERGRQ